jgi:formylglycine-generating enzyme required for sulfatase activity
LKNTLKIIRFAAIIAVIGLAALLMKGCLPPDDSDYLKSIYDQSSKNDNNNNNNNENVKPIEMVPIPAGTFIMGSPESEPNRDEDEQQHSVTLSGFSISKYQVTQAQYRAVMGAKADRTTAEQGKGDNYPIHRVSWYDAIVFCNKLSIKEGFTPAYSINGETIPVRWGTIPTSNNDVWNAVVIVEGSNGYRLPTEAQWEYACRAGTTTVYNTGDTISDDTGWYNNNSESKAHEVGLKPANEFGLYDMHGNVWEWCWDWHDSSYYSNSPANDPLGASSGTFRVGRGGSCCNSAEHLRSAYRENISPHIKNGFFGLRLVRP